MSQKFGRKTDMFFIDILHEPSLAKEKMVEYVKYDSTSRFSCVYCNSYTI